MPGVVKDIGVFQGWKSDKVDVHRALWNQVQQTYTLIKSFKTVDFIMTHESLMIPMCPFYIMKSG